MRALLWINQSIQCQFIPGLRACMHTEASQQTYRPFFYKMNRFQFSDDGCNILTNHIFCRPAPKSRCCQILKELNKQINSKKQIFGMRQILNYMQVQVQHNKNDVEDLRTTTILRKKKKTNKLIAYTQHSVAKGNYCKL